MATSYWGILENLAATIPPDADREDVQMAEDSAMDSADDTSSLFHPGFDWNDVDIGRLEDSAQANAVAEFSKGILQRYRHAIGEQALTECVWRQPRLPLAAPCIALPPSSASLSLIAGRLLSMTGLRVSQPLL
ncbi:hypothetical protein M407DRAFT_22582 [Tulasnella calospora MUT 4182]|uniref:Uncharacterized protein n=1 Tax=Tulasnella calospora MUT 4182 TaxID=1051891 RepID=A0A0C3QL50_9AGAM|nr:hypothetical protein M407DRAFT_22582 [Tulasnella calospora MUT 4182]